MARGNKPTQPTARCTPTPSDYFGPAGTVNPALAPAEPVKYTLVLYKKGEGLKKKGDFDSKSEATLTKADVLSAGEYSRLAENCAIEQEEAGKYSSDR